MSIINMLRGGKANGDNGNTYNFNMYPRPDLLTENMATKKGWEHAADSFHFVQRLDLCACFNSGAIKRAKDSDPETDSCKLEVGDEIPLVWIPNRSTIEAVTLEVNSGVTGVTLGVKRYKALAGDKIIANGTEEEVILSGSDASPLAVEPVTQAEIDALSCNDRLPLDRFCAGCSGQGCYYEHWFDERVLVGGCEFEGQYLSLVIEALPEDFDCNKCCLDVSLGARVRIPYKGD